MILRSEIQDVLFLDIETAPLLNKAGLSEIEQERIFCICVGKIGNDEDCEFLKLRCFYNDDERYLLLEFRAFLQKLNPQTVLYAHNGKEFDFPLIEQRMLVNNIELPDIFNKTEKNLWELRLLDTVEFWKFSGIERYTSLELLSYIFKIESPSAKAEQTSAKREANHANDLERIVDYCYKDVVTIAQLLLRFNNQNTIRTENIYYV